MAFKGSFKLKYDYRFQFNGIEKVEDFGLNINFARYRSLDASLGRWWQVDPEAEQFYGMSPYTGMGNNPVMMVDSTGDIILSAIAGLTNGIKSIIEGDNFFEGFGKGFLQSFQITAGIFQWDSNLNFGQNLWNTVSKLIWEAPQTAAGLIISQALNVATVVNEVNYFRGATVLDTDIEGGAFAAGSFLVGPEGFRPDFTDHLFVHEFGHYLQSKRMGPLYLKLVGLPSVTSFNIDKRFGTNLHDTRSFEAGANRLAADYFDRHFVDFDRNSFVTGAPSSYFNGRWTRTLGINGRNNTPNPIRGRFHWTDIPIHLITLY